MSLRPVVPAVPAVAAALAAGAGYGAHAGIVTAALLVPVALATSAAAELLARRRPGGLGRQLSLALLLGAAQLLVAVVLFIELMFVSGHDAFFTILVVAYAAVSGAWAARLIARRAVDDLAAVKRTLRAVAAGDRSARTGVHGDDELAALARDVDDMIERLDAEERARNQLIAAVSHDLRTPLTSLRLLTEALGDDLLEPAQQGPALDRMGANVRALSALVDDLFELTRLQGGDLDWTLRQVQLGDLVEETLEAMRPLATRRAVEVRAELPEGARTARANPEQLQRVLFNLVQNAIRHTPADGSVTVRARPGEGDVEIEVADTGTGIAAGDRERVFEPFVRAGGDTARSTGGSGLGLAIARAIVEAHGGRIWVADAEVGASVRFTVPR